MEEENKAPLYNVYSFEPPYFKGKVFFNGKDYTEIIQKVLLDYHDIRGFKNGEPSMTRVITRITICTHLLETEGGTIKFNFYAMPNNYSITIDKERNKVEIVLPDVKHLMDLEHDFEMYGG
jgi:hypothetical protein